MFVLCVLTKRPVRASPPPIPVKHQRRIKESMSYCCLLLEGETGPQHLQFNLGCQLPAKCLQNVFLSSFVGTSVRLWHTCLFVFPCQTSQAIDHLILLQHFSSSPNQIWFINGLMLLHPTIDDYNLPKCNTRPRSSPLYLQRPCGYTWGPWPGTPFGHAF